MSATRNDISSDRQAQEIKRVGKEFLRIMVINGSETRTEFVLVMTVGSLCYLILNLDSHSDRYLKIPSGNQSPCCLLELFGAFDPEKQLTDFYRKTKLKLRLGIQNSV